MDKGANINARDDYDYTPIRSAADNGYRDVVEFLKQHGAQPPPVKPIPVPKPKATGYIKDQQGNIVGQFEEQPAP